jgi:hypothetical protein
LVSIAFVPELPLRKKSQLQQQSEPMMEIGQAGLLPTCHKPGLDF